MGKLVDGKWTTEWYQSDAKGHFIREDTKFRGCVSADESSGFKAEAQRYHLYVSLACPWAHRTLVMRKLKRLEHAISISIVHPHMGENGWEFRDAPGTIPDTINGARYLHQIYTKAVPDYTGRVTVPVLWDMRDQAIVCNESRFVLRMLDREFDKVADRQVNLCPPHLEAQIDREIDALYAPVNNGVYRAGFATSQEAYEEAVGELFEALRKYDERLNSQRFLLGNVFTEADICLFTTLLRFDAVYHYHFKCNLQRLVEFPNLWGFVRDVYQLPGVRETCNLEHIKEHYYTSHPRINPSRIIPQGPPLDFDSPHGRERFG